MIEKLHKKLTLLYTLTTGIILTVVVIAVLLISEQSLRSKSSNSFQNNILNISNKLQSDTVLNHLWLSQMEVDNHLLIHIEENGYPLLYKGSWSPQTPRKELVRLAKTKAKKERIDTGIMPVSSSLSKSSIFTITGAHREQYSGIVLIFPETDGYKSLVLLNDVSASEKNLYWQRFGFILADVIGIIALYFASWYFVGKSLQPIAQSRKRQSEFIAAASHELRSPLAVIQASASAIPSESVAEDHFIANIQSECRRMARLISDMLLLASTDTSSWSIKCESVDMDTLLLSAYEMYEPLCRQRKMHCLLTLPDDALPAVWGDKERFMQILTILLDNAMTYSEEYTEVEISAGITKKHVFISIIDHGCGIPDDKKSQVFDRFFKGDASRKDKEHFGLGLSIAYELVKLHKGSLSIKDTAGGGCTFVIKLGLI